MVLDTLAGKLAEEERTIRAIYIGSYIPRECGIATFTKDLTSTINILNPHCLAEIIALDEPGGEDREYPWEVKFRIQQDDPDSYKAAADYINQSSAEVVILQHEFGIYGGRDGEYIIPFLESIEKPIVTTFHTVLPNPDENKLKIMREVARLSRAVIVMIGLAADRLHETYDVKKEKIVIIPHGVPDMPYGPTCYHKKELGIEDRTVLSTFGLINPGKGIEYAIEAMPEIVKHYPNALYLVLGASHPALVRQYGEEYRERLENMVHSLGMDKHVRFENRYLALEELIKYLRGTDVYITPYLEAQQITSGTLAYAVGSGRPCISTPYLYAREVLDEARGMLVPFRDAKAISQAALRLLCNSEYCKEIEKKAYLYGRSMIWANVALKHLDLFWIIAKEAEARSSHGT